jgi:hypothetical protein
MMNDNFEIIDKENIHTLKFPKTDVLSDGDEIIQRVNDLIRAQALGNLEHSKIKIFFEDDHSKKLVETTVWAVTDINVVLKKGVGIPINRIYKLL